MGLSHFVYIFVILYSIITINNTRDINNMLLISLIIYRFVLDLKKKTKTTNACVYIFHSILIIIKYVRSN